MTTPTKQFNENEFPRIEASPTSPYDFELVFKDSRVLLGGICYLSDLEQMFCTKIIPVQTENDNEVQRETLNHWLEFDRERRK